MKSLPPRQLVAPLLHLSRHLTQGRRNRGRRELHAGHAARRQDAALLAAELLDPPLDHLAQALRHADLDLLQPRAEFPPVVAHGDQPAPDEVVDHAHHEERIAPRSAG